MIEPSSHHFDALSRTLAAPHEKRAFDYGGALRGVGHGMTEFGRTPGADLAKFHAATTLVGAGAGGLIGGGAGAAHGAYQGYRDPEGGGVRGALDGALRGGARGAALGVALGAGAGAATPALSFGAMEGLYGGYRHLGEEAAERIIADMPMRGYLARTAVGSGLLGGGLGGLLGGGVGAAHGAYQGSQDPNTGMLRGALQGGARGALTGAALGGVAGATTVPALMAV